MRHKFLLAAAVLSATFVNLLRAEEPTRQHQNRFDHSTVEFLRIYTKKYLSGMDKSTHVMIANVPGTKFSVAYLRGDTWCGSSGCTLLVLKPVGSSFEVAAKLPAVHTPIIFLSARGGELPEIGVWVQGGGISRGYQAALVSKAGKYPNPTLTKRRVRAGAGVVLIASNDEAVSLFE